MPALLWLAAIAATAWSGARIVEAVTDDADQAPAEASSWPLYVTIAALLFVLWRLTVARP